MSRKPKLITDLEKKLDFELTKLPAPELGIGEHTFFQARPGYTAREGRVLALSLAGVSGIKDFRFLADFCDMKLLDLQFTGIKELQPLAGLSRLTMLGAEKNQIQDLQPLAGLSQLTHLWVSENQIQDLQPLAGLTQLRVLYLISNQIQDLQPLARLPSLITVLATNNNIETLPRKLVENIPEHVFQVRGNPLKSPPLEIVEQGKEAVLNYLDQIEEQGTDRLYEAKLLLVGEGGSGKTSMLNKLIDEDYPIPCEEESTLGVTVARDWTFDIEGENQFQVNLWDFGGQVIQHMTHQFFLTSRALYVLLADTRKEDTRYDYWFEIIRVLGDGSPVLVVLNQKGNQIPSFDFHRYRDHYKQDYAIDQRQVNLANKNLAEFRALKERIKDLLQKLPHIGDPLPASWIPIRGALETLEDPHIHTSRYEEICREHGLTEKADQENLVQYLHVLGVVLHFHDEGALTDTLFLHPQWVLDAVYIILDAEQVKKKHGRFTKDWMFKRWKEKDYSQSECHKLLSLMSKDAFELCYPLEGGKSYIAPQLLPNKQPEVLGWNEDRTELRFRFHYPFMPRGILSRLIVRTHSMIESDHVWQKGVILIKRGHARALVHEKLTRAGGVKVIDIELDGKSAAHKELLTEIRVELRSIHRNSFKGLTCEEQVPLHGNPDRAVEYQYLVQLVADGETWFRFPGLEKKENVRELLGEIPIMKEDKELWKAMSEKGLHLHITQNSHQHVEGGNAVVNADLKALSKAEAKAVNMTTIHFQIGNLKSDMEKLSDRLEQVDPEVVPEAKAVAGELAEAEKADNKEAVKDTDALEDSRDFLGKLMDPDTKLGKTIRTADKAWKWASKAADKYNQLANTFGLNPIPTVFLKK